ncbi:MAG: PHP domain-containing protein [Prevotella sp.]|jgi:histidinol phosphatase-like PHP family hydrolase/predicted nuclease with RNAse H fold/dephospho-CoA kinase|nr:PHP domain-containing protein [Prevotella sp.]
MFDFEIAQYFYNISMILSVFENNKFRAKAYYRAAMAIDSYNRYITELYHKEKLQTIEAIGQSIEKQISEVIETSCLTQLQKLEQKYMVKSYELLLYHGISDHTKKKLLTNRIFTLDELKSQFNVLIQKISFTKGEIEKLYWIAAVEAPKAKRFLYSQAYCLGMEVIDYLKKKLKLETTAASIFFLDTMSISKDKLENIEIGVADNLAIKKIFSLLRRNPRLKNVAYNNSKVTGLTLFGIPFSVITQDTLMSQNPPKLQLNVRGDLHAHSTDSDGISDIQILLRGAEELGFEYFAVTDHSKSLKVSHGLTETEVFRQLSIIREINKTSSVKILAGVEVEILEDGNLDYNDDVLAQFDFVVAGMHTHLGQSALLAKSRLENSLRNPYVDILAHPTARLLGRPGNCFSERVGIPVSVEKIVELCCKYNVAIEINCFPERLDFNVNNIRLASDRGAVFSIGTDSHAVSHLNCIQYGRMLAVEAGLTQEQVLNTRTYDELMEYFQRKRKALPKRTFTPKEFTYYFADNTSIMSGDYKVVGIDLTGSENKPSGWALLSGKRAVTKQIKSDAELINATLKAMPDLVSIDSPLTLPKGRCCTNETCSCSEYGITRHCERMLMKFGIGVYPCLIPSMVNLTNRGIRLASLLYSKGMKVIESYPGVAQDVLNISRKRSGVEHLVTGLNSFGICGDYLNHNVSHDELDAITSALVGYFYANDQYIGIGNDDENYLIIPRPQSDYLNKRVIVGLCGEIAAGKTTLAEYLKFKYGFETRRYSDAICEMYDISYDRSRLQELGAKIADDPQKQRELSRHIMTGMINNRSYVVDGLRHKEDFEELSLAFLNCFIFINIIADFKRRYKRYSENIPIGIDDFKKIDRHGSESDVKEIAEYAQQYINNNKGYKDFYKQVDNILKSHSEKNCEVHH